MQEAGAFAIVFEAIPAAVAAAITERLEIPVIGIGAGAATDGQVLVLHDMLGIFPGQRAALRQAVRRASLADDGAVSEFAAEVRNRQLPGRRAHLLDRPRRAVASSAPGSRG